MTGSHVLIVGARDDVHVAAVVAGLETFGARATVVDAYASETRLSYRVGERDAVFRTGRHVSEAAERFDAVWWRRKPTPRHLEQPSFADREWTHALEPLAALLPDARWVNPRRAEHAFRYKPAQLRLAAESGLSVPPTLVSNDPRDVREFVSACGDTAIYKCLSWYAGDNRFLYTNRINAGDLAAYEENIAQAPGIYQPLIAKRYELRVTIAGTVVLAARIDSQEREETRVDWRRNSPALSYRAIRLPPDVEAALMTFHRASGLVYGAYDLIVTPEGEHVFLEVNPVGQWLWIEYATKLPIARSLAAALLDADPETLSDELDAAHALV